MNFKLTKIKLLVASILGVVIGAFSSLGLAWVGRRPDNWLLIKFGWGIAGFVIAFILTYIIYSLIQKKKEA